MDILGIDIAKRKFDVALLSGSKLKSKVCVNSPEGFEDLKRWLSKQGVTKIHACMEATGTYCEALATALTDAGHVVSIVNPSRVKGFAQSELARTKTDKADAALIARFCSALRPTAWTPPAPEVRELRALVRRLGELQEMRQMEVNRLEAGVASAHVAASIQALIAELDEQLDETQRQIRQHFKDHPDLKKQRDLLTSIPGVGEKTAAVLLGEIGEISAFKSARQLAAFVGLNPRERQSGSSVHGRTPISKVGSARIRHALYMPAVVAKRCNPIVNAFCERLLQRNKAKMAVVVAAMRKLLHLAYGVLKNGQPFNANIAEAY